MRRRLDRLFDTYRRTGDPRALAAVFDGSARELYRLAWHLVGDRHAAEDLVQQTFVAAIEHRETFAAERRVLPWLCGILTHRALDLRRQRRRAPVERDRDDVVDPVDEASRRELEERVAASVRALPDPYRQPLLLHLVHGLGAKEIAEVLDLPDATVRTQLARGLERLRRRLPAGIGAATFAAIPAPLGLPAVRSAVMQHAGATAASGALVTATAMVTGYAMKKTLLVCVALLALVSAWSWWDRSPPPSPQPAVVTQHVEPATSSREPAATAAANDGPARVDANPGTATAGCELEVVLAWHDGTPAADVPVRCGPHVAESWVESWQRVMRTDANGIATFTGLEPGETLTLQTGRGPSHDVAIAAGMNRVEITIDAGVDVLGRVVTIDRQPVAGATVWMSMWPNSDDGEAVATSGTDGAFVIRSATTGHSLTATAPGFGSATAWKVPQVAPDAAIEISVREAPGTLVGTVFAADGGPVANARVLVGITLTGNGRHTSIVGNIVGQDFWPSRFARTDARGTFRVEGLPTLSWPVWIGASGFAPARRIIDVQKGIVTYATFHLFAGATVHGTVREDDGGVIAGARLSAQHRFDDVDKTIGLGMAALCGPPLFARTEAHSDDQGHFELRHVMPGDVAMNAWHGNEGTHLTCTLTEGQRLRWDPELRSKRTSLTLRGKLTDSRGAPLPGWVVTLVGERERTAATGDGGAFELVGIDDVEYRIRAAPRYPGLAPSVDLGTALASATAAHFVVPDEHLPTASIEGRVINPDGSPGEVTIHVLAEVQWSSTMRQSEPDGTFRFSPLAAGRYAVSVHSSAHGNLRIGTYELAHGQHLEVDDFRIPAPGSLRVEIVDVRGERVPGSWITVDGVGDPPGRDGFVSHKEGIATGNLQPGRWLVAARHPLPLASTECTIVAGQQTQLRFVVPDSVPFVLRMPAHAFDRRGMRQVWRDANGTVLRDRELYGQPEGELQMRAPPGTYTLEILDRDGHSATTTFTLDGVGTPVVTLPLPN